MGTLDFKKLDRGVEKSSTYSKKMKIFLVSACIVIFIIAGSLVFITVKPTQTKSVMISGADGKQYKMPQETHAQHRNEAPPSILIIVGNLGLNAKMMNDVLSMRKELLLGFSPYAPKVTDLINDAANNGFDTLLHMPLQPVLYPAVNLGPSCLLDNLSDSENISRAEWVLSKSDTVKGIYANPDEVFTESSDDTDVLMQALADRTTDNKFVFFYYDEMSVKNLDLAAKKIPNHKVSVYLIDAVINDHMPDFKIRESLRYAEAAARGRGIGVVFFESTPVALAALKEWLAVLSTSALKLQSLSTARDILSHAEESKKNHDHESDVVKMLERAKKQNKKERVLN